MLPSTDNISRPRSLGYGARLNDLLVRLVETADIPLDISTSDVQPPQINTNENPEDFSPTKGRVFSRSAFYGGEGLAFAHRPNTTELDRTRFYDSEGVDIARQSPADVPAVRLSNKIDSALDLTAVVDGRMIAASSSTIWIIQGSTVKFSSNPFDASPTWTVENPTLGHAGTVTSITILDDIPYVTINGDGVHRRVAGVWEHWSDRSIVDIWTIKERIFGNSGANLYEVRAGASANSVLLHTLESSKRWHSMASLGPAILAAATDGNVYTFTFETDEETFDLVLYSRTELQGEIPRSITTVQEELFLTTSSTNPSEGTVARLYRCKMNESLTLNRQLIKQWGGDDSQVYNFLRYNSAGDRAAFYLTVAEDDPLGQYRVSVWKYDLTENALSRYLTKRFSGLTASPRIRGSLRFKGKSFFVTYSDVALTEEAQGLWRQTNDYTDYGYIITPLADFFTAIEKVWIGVGLDALSSSANEPIEIYYTTIPSAITNPDPDSNDWHFLTEITGVNLAEELRMRSVKSRYIAFMIILRSTNNTDTPEFYSIFTRAYHGESDHVITLPISVGDVIRRPGHRRVRAKGHGRLLHARLRSMQGADVECEVYQPPLKILGAVEAVSERSSIQYVRGFPVQVAYVRIVGKLLSDTSNLTGENLLGVGMMGIEIMGGVDD